jgi:hypothetical protein
VRPNRELIVPSDDLRRLAVGQAFVCVRHGRQRTALVQIDPTSRASRIDGLLDDVHREDPDAC